MRLANLARLSRSVWLVVVVALVGCDSATHKRHATATPPLSAPVIKINKPSFPCRRGCQAQTTIGIEMCGWQAANRVDVQINAVVRRIFRQEIEIDRRVPQSGQFRGSARLRFIRAERAWQAYAAASC